MEVLRMGEAALRSSQALLQLRPPSVYNVSPLCRISRPIARQYRSSTLRYPTSRSFTTSPSYGTPDTEPANAAEPKQERRHPESSPALPSTPPASNSTVNRGIAALLGNAPVPKRTNSAAPSRTSRLSTPRAQPDNRPSRGVAGANTTTQTEKDRSSMDDLLDSLVSTFEPQGAKSEHSPDQITSMLNPQARTRQTSSPPPAGVSRIPVKVGRTLGRTVYVENQRGMDIGRAFRQLDMLCARNLVRRQANRQRFHERPGMKRKRLKSERWRRRFKEAFKGTVQMVQKMKNQGW